MMKFTAQISRPQVPYHNPYYFWFDLKDGAIPEKLLTLVEAEIESATLSAGKLHGDISEETIRNSDVIGLASSHWFTGIMFNYAAMANQSAKWNRSLSFPEVTQYAEYNPGGFYKWHNDGDPLCKLPHERKLTAICLLSDPSEYEGGQLQIRGLPEAIKLKRGSVVVFPSTLDHQVTEVTKGLRRTLTCWAMGPNSFSA